MWLGDALCQCGFVIHCAMTMLLAAINVQSSPQRYSERTALPLSFLLCHLKRCHNIRPRVIAHNIQFHIRQVVEVKDTKLAIYSVIWG
jgi:hypothetical protein